MCTFHASAANDDFQYVILDLNWRKHEMIASHSRFQRVEKPSDVRSTAECESVEAELRSHRRLLEASAAVDVAVAICDRSHNVESLSVFGVRLGHQVLTSVAVVTAGQIVLFSQLILRYFEIEMIATADS